ncbi:MAG: NUDIX hydrolase [Candidatus Saccharibacteria bacterium]|nr:MAG: NUDIX hydrolase [Candidatus Saccharibacteria bacterium]
MIHLLTIHESDIYPKKEDLNPQNFKLRHAARAVVLNAAGEVALLKATAHNYHKLPGGGVEEGEDMKLALQRELLEEIGCRASITSEIGEIIEYRDKWNMKQISHCYLAEQVGEQQPPAFTQSEIDEGFEVFWASDIEVAIQLLQQDMPENYDGSFIQLRDSELLRAARQKMRSADN